MSLRRACPQCLKLLLLTCRLHCAVHLATCLQVFGDFHHEDDCDNCKDKCEGCKKEKCDDCKDDKFDDCKDCKDDKCEGCKNDKCDDCEKDDFKTYEKDDCKDCKDDSCKDKCEEKCEGDDCKKEVVVEVRPEWSRA